MTATSHMPLPHDRVCIGFNSSSVWSDFPIPREGMVNEYGIKGERGEGG